MTLIGRRPSFEPQIEMTSAAQPQDVNRPQSTNIESNVSREEFDIVGQQLKPADGGLAAWRMLWAAFVFEALLWGKHELSHRIIAPHWIQLLNVMPRLPYILWCLSELLLSTP